MGDCARIGDCFINALFAVLACMNIFDCSESCSYLRIFLRAVGGVVGPPLYSFFDQLHGGEYLTAFFPKQSW